MWEIWWNEIIWSRSWKNIPAKYLWVNEKSIFLCWYVLFAEYYIFVAMLNHEWLEVDKKKLNWKHFVSISSSPFVEFLLNLNKITVSIIGWSLTIYYYLLQISSVLMVFINYIFFFENMVLQHSFMRNRIYLRTLRKSNKTTTVNGHSRYDSTERNEVWNYYQIKCKTSECIVNIASLSFVGFKHYYYYF